MNYVANLCESICKSNDYHIELIRIAFPSRNWVTIGPILT